jgi:hypothetical protein
MVSYEFLDIERFGFLLPLGNFNVEHYGIRIPVVRKCIVI